MKNQKGKGATGIMILFLALLMVPGCVHRMPGDHDDLGDHKKQKKQRDHQCRFDPADAIREVICC